MCNTSFTLGMLFFIFDGIEVGVVSTIARNKDLIIMSYTDVVVETIYNPSSIFNTNSQRTKRKRLV